MAEHCSSKKQEMENRNLLVLVNNVAPRVSAEKEAKPPITAFQTFGGINEKKSGKATEKVGQAFVMFWVHSGCSERTQHLQIFIPIAPRTRRMLPERFPYMPYAPTMLPEYFPNTHGRHIRMVDEYYFEHAQQIFGATKCRSVCIRTEPNSQCAPRTHRMLPEYDPFAPRTPKFLFGKQTEWHSAQCERANRPVLHVSK
ncbi:hypothetical protein GWK47_028641 [Chionoecetes opilio]|uniref:Uncharacterized protein n=1 Tax=Chionoecetes opilio TaxID=41210 RepID=A0A8J5CRX5_CHIOP|nr:hypothetical protein GWK47_028641 [Chionoecetes opilio]